MKKIVLFAAIIVAAGFASCTSQAPKADLKNDVDSLSYMIGVSNTQGVDMYTTRQLGLDTTYMADFKQGLTEGFNASKKEAAYAIGMMLGHQISADVFDRINESLFGHDSVRTSSLSKDNFLAGFVAAINKKEIVSMKEANEYVQKSVKEIQEKALEAKYADNKAAGEKFLAENAKKEGVVTTESGLQYKVIKAGKGEIPTKESTVKVHYKGTLIDGTEFDSSYSRKEPAKFGVTGVIKGWTEALQLMPVGSKWELYIPQELAYGSQNRSAVIKPFSTLVFEIELLGIEKKK